MAAPRVPLALIVAVTAVFVAVGAVPAVVVGNVPPPPGEVPGVLVRKDIIKKACIYDRDCPRNAFCKQQKECSCKEGYFIHKEESKNELCLKRVMGEGDGCTEASQCQLALGPAAQCRSEWGGSVCRCNEWAHGVDGRCYNTSRVGEYCVSKNNCLLQGGPTLTCAGGLCVCPRLQHGSADGWRCLDDRRLGEDCLEDEECITANSHCMGICECRVQYVTNDRNRRCLRVADSVGAMCEEDLQCNRFIPDSECGQLGQCRCRDGYHPGPQGVRCWRSSMLGETCGTDWECLGLRLPVIVPYNTTLAVCDNNRCRCEHGYAPDDTGRRCVEGSAVRLALPSWLLLAAVAAAVASARAQQ